MHRGICRDSITSCIPCVMIMISMWCGVFAHPAKFPCEFRSTNGYGNNEKEPWLGTPHSYLMRLTEPAYTDGKGEPSGENRPNPREISNTVHAQGDSSIPNHQRISDIFWTWGQFIDHDLGLSPFSEEHFDIPVPAGDPVFDPYGTGNSVLPFVRSEHAVSWNGVRQQINEITSFMDASQVYGSDYERAMALRTLDGTGMLKTSAGNLLPFNKPGLPNDGGTSESLFLAGDVRANENVALTSMHTIFVREHNLWCRLLAHADDGLTGDQIYHLAKAIVGAEIQSVTYNEFLPLLLGARAIPPYKGYRLHMDPEMCTEFTTAAFRFGHSMLSPSLQRLDSKGKPLSGGSLSLEDAFLNPDELVTNGIEPIMRGALKQVAQKVDVFIVDGVRNFLFVTNGKGGTDLAAINIQRGRDHGLKNYNQVRKNLGLGTVNTVYEISSDPEVCARLSKQFGSPDEIDLWTGGLAEDMVAGALLGPTFRFILAHQFTRTRDGDRFWYQTYLPGFMVWFIERRSLADIIRHNTDIGLEETGWSAFVVCPDITKKGDNFASDNYRGLQPDQSFDHRLMDAECAAAAEEFVRFFYEQAP
ncbi:MAG: peroxiredoxin [Chitinivibrionales bacterium]|nr:peroxiredoxin [Chitinivibrionales bacterium]MBD3355802.1 peroxiredoxin [Chitinivibrionales bacterium]